MDEGAYTSEERSWSDTHCMKEVGEAHGRQDMVTIFLLINYKKHPN